MTFNTYGWIHFYLIPCLTIMFLKSSLTSKIRYQPNWDSLDSRPLPQWYDQAKIGIFIHWGVYAVPSLTSEWFWFDWLNTHHNPQLHEKILKYMKNNYKPGFSYQDFASDFTAEFFNATQWVQMIEKSGARYVVLTSKHHDGFALWPSKYSYSWNSVDKGAHRDIVGELAEAVRNSSSGIHFGLYHSLYEWFHPVYVEDRSRNFTTQYFVNNKIYPEMIELVNTYKPEIFWSDGEEEAESRYWRSEEFLAWLYNDSPVQDRVVVNDRWGTGTACNHGGYYTCADRYTPGSLQEHKWENAMTLDRNSWGYSRTSTITDYLTTQELIDTLVQTVAFGGNILINIGPSKDGRIAPIFEERLTELGDWLTTNGEAVFGSQPWEVCQNDTTTHTAWYTAKGSSLYVTVLRWPPEGKLYLSCLTLKPLATVHILGTSPTQLLKWTVEKELLMIILPDKSTLEENWGWVLKIEDNAI